MTTAIIVAGGRGERLPGDVPKQFRDLGGLPILDWSVRAFETHDLVDAVVVVLPAELAEAPPDWLAGRVQVVAGGETRAESVARGVVAAGAQAGALLVHDAVRPFVTSEMISRVLASAVVEPTVPAVPLQDTIKEIYPGGRVRRTHDRSSLRATQTPQGFPAGLLQDLVAGADLSASVTDEGVLCELAGVPVCTVEGDPANLKITTATDFDYACWLVETGMITRPTVL